MPNHLFMPIDLIQLSWIFEYAFESGAELLEMRAHDLTEAVERVYLLVNGQNRVGKSLAYPS